jgi:hypothetical protein
MSQRLQDYLDNPTAWNGEIEGPETWWVAHQEALEHAGYMLRPRYRPGWKPPWAGTNKNLYEFEDGQLQSVSAHALPPGARVHELPAAPVHGCNSDL